jgi:hypothetical protein
LLNPAYDRTLSFLSFGGRSQGAGFYLEKSAGNPGIEENGRICARCVLLLTRHPTSQRVPAQWTLQQAQSWPGGKLVCQQSRRFTHCTKYCSHVIMVHRCMPPSTESRRGSGRYSMPTTESVGLFLLFFSSSLFLSSLFLSAPALSPRRSVVVALFSLPVKSATESAACLHLSRMCQLLDVLMNDEQVRHCGYIAFRIELSGGTGGWCGGAVNRTMW